MLSLPWRTVLVPYDLSEPAAAAIRTALEAAGEGVDLHVLHVVQSPHMADPYSVWVGLTEQEQVASAEKAIRESLGKEGLGELRVEVRIGSPALLITEYAREIGADAVVMPTHGRTGLSRLVIGSVTERVVRLAPCPVVVLRE